MFDVAAFKFTKFESFKVYTTVIINVNFMWRK